MSKGATSILQNVGTRIDRDFSLQQDRLVSVPNSAGPSNAFQQRSPRTRQAAPPQHQPFDLSSLQRHLSPPIPQSSFPQVRPQAQVQSNWAASFRPPQASTAIAGPSQQQQRSHARSSWHDDFIQHQSQHRPTNQQYLHKHQGQDTAQKQYQPQTQYAQTRYQNPTAYYPAPQVAPWQRPATIPYQQDVVNFDHLPRPGTSFDYPVSSSSSSQIDNPIPQMEASPVSAHQQSQTHQTQPSEPLNESQNLLARTAHSLITDLESSQTLQSNPKLQQSQFMQLMRGLGGGDVIVQDEPAVITNSASEGEVGAGATFITRPGAAAGWASDFLGDAIAGPSHLQPALPQSRDSTINQSGTTAHAHFGDQDALVMPSDQAAEASRQRCKSVHFSEQEQPETSTRLSVPNSLEEALSHRSSIPGATSSWGETSLEDDADFDMETFMQFNGPMRHAGSSRIGIGDMESWGSMQDDWEAMERSPGGKGKGRMNANGAGAGNYLFQARNPYTDLMEVEGGDMDYGRHSPTHVGVMELEAAVQRNPRDHQAWYNLGLKQQENEREHQAIKALRKVTELAPEYRPAYLASAVSLTNEGDRDGANEMLAKWIDLSQGIDMQNITTTESGSANVNGNGSGDWLAVQRKLVERLIEMARMSPEEVDADVQIALGVLFNASEEYKFAEDCLLAALSVRPDDWLLYNRLGATLANSGRSSDAVGYYHKALELHPTFVRALFNLGTSYINLAQYPAAADKLLSALRFQQADATEGYASGTIGSAAKGVTSDVLWNTLRAACVHMGKHDLVQAANRKDLTAFPDMFSEMVRQPSLST